MVSIQCYKQMVSTSQGNIFEIQRNSCFVPLQTATSLLPEGDDFVYTEWGIQGRWGVLIDWMILWPHDCPQWALLAGGRFINMCQSDWLYNSDSSGKPTVNIHTQSGFPHLLKNHWNSDLFQDHGKIIEFHEKFLKFVKMKKSGENHWILDQLLMEKWKSLNSQIDIVLTNYMGK